MLSPSPLTLKLLPLVAELCIEDDWPRLDADAVLLLYDVATALNLPRQEIAYLLGDQAMQHILTKLHDPLGGIRQILAE